MSSRVRRRCSSACSWCSLTCLQPCRSRRPSQRRARPLTMLTATATREQPPPTRSRYGPVPRNLASGGWSWWLRAKSRRTSARCCSSTPSFCPRMPSGRGSASGGSLTEVWRITKLGSTRSSGGLAARRERRRRKRRRRKTRRRSPRRTSPPNPIPPTKSCCASTCSMPASRMPERPAGVAVAARSGASATVRTIAAALRSPSRVRRLAL
mmetsp:Transcript_16672/g.42833  ORF Transcript_16672/g.42833 Transcript_16672/m.42833 type:complete len:210 (-) Transcript_16672:72-701(-)